MLEPGRSPGGAKPLSTLSLAVTKLSYKFLCFFDGGGSRGSGFISSPPVSKPPEDPCRLVYWRIQTCAIVPVTISIKWPTHCKWLISGPSIVRHACQFPLKPLRTLEPRRLFCFRSFSNSFLNIKDGPRLYQFLSNFLGILSFNLPFSEISTVK